MPDSSFYLGRWSDDRQPVRYDPADLTTHAVVIGMTGSGKTGLLIALLEEAARQGLPAVIIDPKGDLTNLLLHFPELRPEDFAPWIDPEEARRAGQPVEAMAAATAERWRKGLADWDLGRAELAALRDAVDYTIYTPGSTAGTPVNLLSSFEAPPDWDSNSEALRERIASTVTALLGLVGMDDVDPLRSREHILLANILENAWSQGISLDLAGLIEQVNTPPFERLGAFPLDRFFPAKDRFELALLLNNFLAAPSFQTWLAGQPLDIPALLRTPQGKPRFSIFYIAHLGDNERMFFVTLLLAAVESWMRGQRGTSSLRALLAFDEIVGYLPPVANPPSRGVLLRLLKQARAFGLGLALATQNPTDLNYKALSNAGTWIIGRLQTEQDKQRLLDGLQSLDTGIDRSAFDTLIAGLKPRLFLLHNVHADGSRVFQSRWDLNYLAGPLTRAQIPALKPPASAPAAVPLKAAPPRPAPTGAPPFKAPPSEPSPAAPLPGPVRQAKPPVSRQPAAPQGYTTGHPALPPGANEYYFPLAMSVQRALSAHGGALRGPLEPQGTLYRPALLAQAEVRYYSTRYNLDHARRVTCLLLEPDLTPDWDACARHPFDPAALGAAPLADARFSPLPGEYATARSLAALQRDFLDWAYRGGTIYVRANPSLKVYAGPDVSDEIFRLLIEAALRDGLQAEMAKIAAGYDQKLETLKRKIERQQLTVDRRSDSVGQRRAEQTSSDFELFASVFSKRKRSLSSTLSKRRMTQQAQGELETAKKVLKDQQEAWKDLRDERQAALQAAQLDWQSRAAQVTQIAVTPLKKDIFAELFGIAWLPYYAIKNPDGLIEIAGF